MAKWHYKKRGEPGAVAETIRWHLERQYLMDGGLDVNLWVVITTRSHTAESVWAGVTLTAAQLDDPVVVVTLSEAEEAAEEGRHENVKQLLDLLSTM